MGYLQIGACKEKPFQMAVSGCEGGGGGGGSSQSVDSFAMQYVIAA